MKNKEEKLVDLIKKQGRVAVAFSGGIDSVYLTNKAIEVLGKENVLAIIVNSELFTDEEFEKAKETASILGVSYEPVYMHELQISAIANNKSNTWYSSKKELYSLIKETAAKQEISTVFDGMIMDDLNDFRPGMTARDDAGVLSPLQEANLYKVDIRRLAKQDGINVWNKIASCSLCSRFPYNTHITSEMIKQVIEGERFMRQLGFNPIRVRHHGTTARLEVVPEKINKLVQQKEAIVAEFKKLGFLYVAMDFEGYVEGKMNKTLTETEKQVSYTA